MGASVCRTLPPRPLTLPPSCAAAVATAQAAEAAAEEEEDVAPSRGDAETKCVDSPLRLRR